MTFCSSRRRLLEIVRMRIRNGDFTERYLARALGVSQPHMHNVLKGVKSLNPELADRLLTHLKMDLSDLAADQAIAPQ